MFENAKGVLALMLCDGLSPLDSLRLETTPADAMEWLRDAAGRRHLAVMLERTIGAVDWDEFERQCDGVERSGAGMVTWWDTDYPQSLREIAQPPPLLIYKGNLDALSRRGVGVVGTRKPTPGGSAFARKLARGLAAADITVASGLARGIDTAAHVGSLPGPGLPVAVIGTGIDIPYPTENAGLMVDIARRGCVVTEQLMGRSPTPFVFPQRNRLIAGLSAAVVVVEGGVRSGALITARWALEQGRDVCAVPGFPGDFRSAGPNQLIKHGAYLVEGVEDVLRAVPSLTRPELWDGAAGERQSEAHRPVRDGVRAVYDAIGTSPAHVDDIAERTGVSVALLQQMLAEMEIEGLVVRDDGGGYSRAV